MNKKIIEFLRESNAIEGVYDEDSLKQAIYAWEYIEEQKELTPHDVLRTHAILMKNQNLLPSEKGYFRRCAVYIGGRQGLHHEKIAKAIDEWVTCMHQENQACETVSGALHIQYEKIHPFVDGNGRTGRIFMNWWRVKNGLPILVIKEGERQEYYKWFK
jgi:Fic family protein